MEMLINVQTNMIGEVITRTAESVTLRIEGLVKTYTKSTIRRWWKAYTMPTPVAVEPATTQSTLVTTRMSNYLIAYATGKGCTVKETKSYFGIKSGKSTIMEIHTTKKGKTTIVLNSKAHSQFVIDELIENHGGKLVPESYGWTLNLKVNADTISECQAEVLLQRAIEFVR